MSVKLGCFADNDFSWLKLAKYEPIKKIYYMDVGEWPSGVRYQTCIGLWPVSVKFLYRIKVTLK